MGQALGGDEPKWAHERGIKLARGTHTVRISCPFCSVEVEVSPKTKPGEIFRVTGFTCPSCHKTVTVEDIQNALSRKSGVIIHKIRKIVKSLELESKTPENQMIIVELNEISDLLKEQQELKDILSTIVDQTSPPTLLQRIQENVMEYFITLAIGVLLGLFVRFVG